MSSEQAEMNSSHLYYLMGFVQDDGKKEVIDAFLRSDKLKEHSVLSMHWLDKTNGCLELLLILETRRKQWAEKKWEAFVFENIEERLMVRVQTAQTVSRGPEGSSCVSRLIEKNLSALGLLQHHDRLFDGYRIASGGRMHHMDERPWRMKSCVLTEMKRERLEEESAILKLKTKILEAPYVFFY